MGASQPSVPSLVEVMGMPHRPMSRKQQWLLPPSLDEVVPADHPARFVAEFVDALDRDAWAELGIDLDGDPPGAPAYHPRALLSVWVYGFMTGVRSSRKLEAAFREQLPYLWLTGCQTSDHITLWRFYAAPNRSSRPTVWSSRTGAWMSATGRSCKCSSSSRRMDSAGISISRLNSGGQHPRLGRTGG